MSFLLPKAPAPPETPAPPRRTDAEVADAAAEQRRKLYQEAPGRRGTMAGGLGVMGLYPTSTSRLLGVA